PMANPSTYAIFTVSLHDALPICAERGRWGDVVDGDRGRVLGEAAVLVDDPGAHGRRARAVVEDTVDRGRRAGARVRRTREGCARAEERAAELRARGHLVWRPRPE